MLFVRRNIMASLHKNITTSNNSKAEKGNVSHPLRSKSTNARPDVSMTRTLKSQSTPAMDKVNRGGLVDSMKNMSLRDRLKSAKNVRIPNRILSSATNPLETLEDISQYIAANKVRNVVVMAGAGISTASGIPDFRTPGTGLYDNLLQYKIPYPEAIFDIDYFNYNPRPFFALAKDLYPSGQYQPNVVHHFCRLLNDKGLLLRMYTQNIDGLERLAGIPPHKLVEAHGTFSSATCVYCRRKYNGDEIKWEILNGQLPMCRSTLSCNGIIKPDIVFFGEDLPKKFWYYLKDFPQADLLIVMGTSLKVEPFAGIVDYVRFPVPRILFNLDAVGPFKKRRRMNDFAIVGDLVTNIKAFTECLRWQKDLETLAGISLYQLPENTTSESHECENIHVNSQAAEHKLNSKCNSTAIVIPTAGCTTETETESLKENEEVPTGLVRNEPQIKTIKNTDACIESAQNGLSTSKQQASKPTVNNPYKSLNRRLHSMSASNRLLTKRGSTGSLLAPGKPMKINFQPKSTLPELTPKQRVVAFRKTLNQLSAWRNPIQSSSCDSSDDTTSSSSDSSDTD